MSCQVPHAQAHELYSALCVVVWWQQHTTMRAISHRAQAHKLFILATTAKNVDNEALVCKRTMHELRAQAHKLSTSHRAQAHELLISHRVQAHKLLITAAAACQWQGPWRKPKAFTSRCLMATTTTTMAMTTTNFENKALGMSTMRPCAQAHGIFISRCANATTTTTIGDNERQVSDNEALCTSAQHNSHCVQVHILCIKHRRHNQPGNVKLIWARATSSNIDNLVHEHTRLSSLIRKHMSYSVKHRCSNQPFQRQA